MNKKCAYYNRGTCCVYPLEKRKKLCNENCAWKSKVEVDRTIYDKCQHCSEIGVWWPNGVDKPAKCMNCNKIATLKNGE